MTVIQRSASEFSKAGVNSDQDSLECFTKPGRWVFQHQRSIRWSEFWPAIIDECGSLSKAECDAVINGWENY